MIKRKRMVTILTITLILLICFFVSLYMVGIKSEPYRVALKFIDNDKTIFETTGPLKSHRLAVFGYFVRYRGPRGIAEYKIVVKGEKGGGEVYLELEKSVGIWRVTKGNLVLNDERTVLLIRSKK